MTPTNADVVICGAGIAGVATAYYLAAQHGIRDVVLVDKRAPLTLTSDKSTECYRNWWPDPVMARFMDRSIDLLEDLALDTGNAFNLNRRGYAYVTTSEAGVEALRQSVRHHESLGLGPVRVHDGSGGRYVTPELEGFEAAPDGADLLLGDTIQREWPCLSDDVQAMVHPRRCGWMSAQGMGMVLLEKAKALGVQEWRGVVVSVEQDAGGVSGVQIAIDGNVERVETRHFVNAAGPFIGQVGSMLGVEVPVKNVLHQKIAIRDHLGIVPRNAPMFIMEDEVRLDWSDEEAAMWAADPEYQWLLESMPAGVHVRPEGGEDSPWILVVWGYEHHPQEPVWEPALTTVFPEVAMRGIVKVVPGLGEYVGRIPSPMMHDGGYYTKTEENMLLVGPIGVEGAHLIGALSGYGVMAAPAAGELCAAWVAGAELPDYAQALTLARYDDAAYVAALKERGPSGEI